MMNNNKKNIVRRKYPNAVCIVSPILWWIEDGKGHRISTNEFSANSAWNSAYKFVVGNS